MGATLGLAARHRAAESWEATKEFREAETMQSHILVALFLTFVLAQEEPETKELLGSRRKINLVNNVLHSTVRKIPRPYRNKIPRTFTKNTRVHRGRLERHGASHPLCPDKQCLRQGWQRDPGRAAQRSRRALRCAAEASGRQQGSQDSRRHDDTRNFGRWIPDDPANNRRHLQRGGDGPLLTGHRKDC